MDQVEDHLVFDEPVEVVNNDYVTFYITEVSYTKDKDNNAWAGFWFKTHNNSDSEYIEMYTINLSVGDYMIDFPHCPGYGGLIAPGKIDEGQGYLSDYLSSDMPSSVEDMLLLEGAFQCSFYKNTNSYNDRYENYNFSLKNSLRLESNLSTE